IKDSECRPTRGAGGRAALVRRRRRAGRWRKSARRRRSGDREGANSAGQIGLKTVNVVRRAELVEELRSLGGDVVLVDGENLRDDVAAATGKAPIRLARSD